MLEKVIIIEFITVTKMVILLLDLFDIIAHGLAILYIAISFFNKPLELNEKYSGSHSALLRCNYDVQKRGMFLS